MIRVLIKMDQLGREGYMIYIFDLDLLEKHTYSIFDYGEKYC